MLPADVASQDWYAPAVRYVMEYDLMDVGRPDDGTTVFEPLRTVSRQEVADAICRAARCLSTKFAGEPSQSGISGMADYAEIGQDYYNAMAFCYENGIMTGSDKKLNPGAAITRQEFAAVLQRTMKLFAENGLAEIVPGDGMAVYEFSDSRSIQNWAISSVSFCIKNHLMQGRQQERIQPAGQCKPGAGREGAEQYCRRRKEITEDTEERRSFYDSFIRGHVPRIFFAQD